VALPVGASAGVGGGSAAGSGTGGTADPAACGAGGAAIATRCVAALGAAAAAGADTAEGSDAADAADAASATDWEKAALPDSSAKAARAIAASGAWAGKRGADMSAQYTEGTLRDAWRAQRRRGRVAWPRQSRDVR